MYSPHGRRKANSNRTDDAYDGERPQKPGCQLPGIPTDQDVLGREPHTLTDPVNRSRSLLSVGKWFHLGGCSDEVGACDTPGMLAMMDKGFGRGDPHLLLLAGKERWLVAQAALKRGHLGGRGGVAIDGVFGP